MLIQAMPGSSRTSAAGIELAPDGAVFLGGAASQQRWKTALGPLPTLWVGVRCESAVAAGREIARGDRIMGMAAAQADAVHQSVDYDLPVGTTHTEAWACAQAIAARVH